MWVVFVILLGLHKNVNNRVIVVLVDKDGVDIAVELQLVFKGKDIQLLAGEAALAHGAGVVGVQAAAHAEHSVLGVAWRLANSSASILRASTLVSLRVLFCAI